MGTGGSAIFGSACARGRTDKRTVVQTAPALFSDEGTAKLPAVMHDGILQAALGVRLPLKLKVAAAKVVGVKSCWDYTGLDESEWGA